MQSFLHRGGPRGPSTELCDPPCEWVTTGAQCRGKCTHRISTSTKHVHSAEILNTYNKYKRNTVWEYYFRSIFVRRQHIYCATCFILFTNDQTVKSHVDKSNFYSCHKICIADKIGD